MWECDTYFEMDVGVLDLTIIYSWLIAFSFIVSLIEAPLEAKWEVRRRVIQVIVFKKIKSLELLPIGDRRLTDWKGMMRRSVVCSVRISWIFIWICFTVPHLYDKNMTQIGITCRVWRAGTTQLHKLESSSKNSIVHYPRAPPILQILPLAILIFFLIYDPCKNYSSNERRTINCTTGS